MSLGTASRLPNPPAAPDASCDVLIQGAGIGGLTLAIALQQRGCTVRVVERSPGLAEVGAGIWMAPNPMQVFERLGFADDVVESGWPVSLLHLQDSKSGDIQVTDMSKAAKRFGFETIAIHRAALLRVLYAQLRGDPVIFGCEASSLVADANRVYAALTNGTNVSAAIVVGADGHNSRIRELAGLDGVKRYSGSSSYRAIARGAHVLDVSVQHDAYEIWARGCRVGFSKINQLDYYWYLTFDAPAAEAAPARGYFDHAKRLFQSHFPQWIGLLERTKPEDILRTDISDLAPLRSWSRGRIGLVGDAAHATTPNLGQGGAMAVEDALALAEAFDEDGLSEKAWQRFEAARREKVDWTVSTSRAIGKLCHIGNPLLRAIRNALLRATPKRTTEIQLERIYRVETTAEISSAGP